MAKTKFLDYTGLAKLVEKIKNTYVNKNEQYEANLKWGGGNFANSFGPIDGAMVQELGANRFAFGNPRGITVEYSNDGGNTWHDYGAIDEQKLKLTTTGTPFYLGKHAVAPPSLSNMLRITFDVTVDKGIVCYTSINKFIIYVSTAGMSNCYCTVQAATNTKNITYNDIATKVPINGWSGYNVINVPNFRTCELSTNENNYNYRYIRFIFGADSIYSTQYYDMCINKIYAYGGMGWRVPSNLAKIGKLYSYDESQNATFPANVTATNFIGTLQGNANSASKLGTATVGGATQPIYLSGGTPTECTYTLAQNVTSASKLTDHLYNAGEGLKLTTGTTADTFSLSAATSSTIGGVKIGNNISITSGTISLTKGNVVNALGYTPPTADTNTHYTTGLIVGNSSSSTGNTAVTTNGVFLNLKDDNHIRNSHKIVGGGGTTVTSDSGGTITISSTDKKVYQEVDTTTIGSTPLLLSPLSEDAKTGETHFTTSAKINFNIVAVPKSGTLKATHFIGTTFSGDTFSGTTFTGNAATATRLSTSTAGGETQPVYFDGGIPKPLKYTIGKSVPSDATFTDTKYTLSGDGTNKVTITDSNKSQQSITINNVQKATVATYANQYLYNNSPKDFVYDAADNEYHNIRCQDDTIIVANKINLNRYEFIINADGTGRCCIYDDGNSMGTFWGVDGMVFEKAPANSLVATNGTFATAISDTDIKNAINSAIDWTQAL